MARDRKPLVRKGKAGHVANFHPSMQHDAQSLLVVLAEKAKAPRTTRGGKDMPRSPRSKDGQSTNYAGFGDQYFRLKSSLVPKTGVMQKQGERLVYVQRDPEERERARLAYQARQIELNMANPTWPYDGE